MSNSEASPIPAAPAPVVYYLKNMSTMALSVGMLIALVVPVLYILAGSVLVKNGIALLCGLPFLAVLIYYLFKNVLMQKMTVTFLGETMCVKYTSKPFFDKESNRTIAANDILSYETIDYKGKSLTVYLKDGGKFRAAKGEIDQANDFSIVSDRIMAMIAARNAIHSLEPILKKDNIYEGKRGKRLGIVFIVLICLLLAGIFFFPEQHKTKDVVYAVGCIFMMLSYVVYIFSLTKGSRSAKEE